MKQILISTLLLSLGLACATAQSQRIGTIDLQKVFDEYYKTRAADATLKERALEFDKEKKSLVEHYEKLKGDYRQALDDANNQAISSEEREKRKKAAESKLLEIREHEQTIQQFDVQARTTMEEQQRRVRDKILEEIQAVIDTKAKAANYNFVFDTAGRALSSTRVLVYTSGEDDLTSQVLMALNANAPPDLLKPQSRNGGDTGTGRP